MKNKKLNLFILIALLLILSFVIIIINKGIIIKNLINKSTLQSNIANQYTEYFQYNDNSITVITSFAKDGKYLRKQKNIDKLNGNVIDEMIEQFDGEKCNLYIKSENENQEYYDVQKNNIMPIESNLSYLPTNTLDFIKSCLFSDIKTVECNGIEAYKFTNLYNNQPVNTNDDNCVYIDKETGLVLRASSGTVSTDNTSYNTIIELNYKFNSVTDNDISNINF